MPTILALLRHGRATGQGPNAELTAEGAGYIELLAERLAGEGWTPAAAFSSPYGRARDTAKILLEHVAPGVRPSLLDTLTPESDPDEAIAVLQAAGLPQGRVLVVAHLPLLGLISQRLTGEDPGFHPGKLVEIELAPNGVNGHIVRQVGADDLLGH